MPCNMCCHSISRDMCKQSLPVGGHDDLDIHSLVKPVHLCQQLHQNALHLPVSSRLAVSTLCRQAWNTELPSD